MPDDNRLFSPEDLPAAFGLLTRIPVPPSARGARAAWAWPLVGLTVGLAGMACGWLALILGLPSGFAAALVLAVMALLTGAMHEDGLADTADGLFGGRDRDSRLAIMKDSRIGTFGAVALLLVTLARFSLIAILLHSQPFAIAVAAALSRLPMAALMAALPPARMGGLAVLTGRPPRETVLAAAAIALAIALPFAGFATVLLFVALIALTFGIGHLARQRIGGQTGDILGAAGQLGETLMLAVLASLYPLGAP